MDSGFNQNDILWDVKKQKWDKNGKIDQRNIIKIGDSKKTNRNIQRKTNEI